MIAGDLCIWASRFRSIDERILERIAFVWQECQNLLTTQPEEDDITINLVSLLCKDPIVRRLCHWVEFQFEPTGTDSTGMKYSKGKIDIAVLFDWERDRYLAYECKRLNVTHNGKRSSLAKVYVTEGMMRFMKEQYAEGLPVGCMLGYVLDGDKSFAIQQLTKVISSHEPLGLSTGPTMIASLQRFDRFVTNHLRTSATSIELRHALLPLTNKENLS